MWYDYILLTPQNIAIAYFLDYFLYSENRFVSFVKVFLYYEIIVNSSTLFLFHDPLVRLLSSMIFFTISIFLFFPEERMVKKLWALPFELGVMALVEIPIVGFYFGIYHQSYQAMPTLPVYILQGLLMFIAYYGVIGGFEVDIFNRKREHVYFGLCLVLQTVMIYISSTLFIDLGAQNAYAGLRFIASIVILLLQLILIILLIHSSRKAQRESTFLMLQEEYERQLEQYLDHDTDRSISMLRHDIINHMQNLYK